MTHELAADPNGFEPTHGANAGNRPMTPCIHIDPTGRRCTALAAEGANFCPHHDSERLALHPVQRWGFRLAALLLLLLILFELYSYLRDALR